MKPTSEILKRIYGISMCHSQAIFTRLFRYLLREDIYFKAYENLYANKGAATKGSDDDTADGFSLEYVRKIIKEIKELTYQPKPVRRTYIQKRNGKLRPLGVPSFRDKLVQDVIRQILQAIYEPVFSSHSHGFRPHKSCHSALEEIKYSFKGTNWFIEGDICGCFDNIDHKILLNLLQSKIKDSKFLNLIRKFLKAGYLEDWKYHRTYSGTPQGGILSPILANIYLNELDNKVEQLASLFYKKADHCRSRIYEKQRYFIRVLRKQYSNLTSSLMKRELLKQIHKEQVKLRRLPSKDRSDKRIVYVRYADDFIIAIAGNRKEAESIKTQLKIFLLEHLKLELSEEKTYIRHTSQNALFLGYHISVRRNNLSKKTRNGVVQRTLNNQVQLLVPIQRIEKFLYERKAVRQAKNHSLEPIHNSALLAFTDIEIVNAYNEQARGFCNYYQLASNFPALNYFLYLMEYSCLKTLACKHKTRVSKIIGKYRTGHSWSIPYDTKSGKKRLEIVRYKNLKRNLTKHDVKVDEITIRTSYKSRNSLEARLKANKCELCGLEGDSSLFEIHHVNKLKNLKGKHKWEIAMIARKRKTLVVCKQCHRKIHSS